MNGHGHLERHHGDKISMHGHGMMEGRNEMSYMEDRNMQTTFSLKTYSDFLFEGVNISTFKGIILAMVFTTVISILLDSLKFIIHMREHHRVTGLRIQDQKPYWDQYLHTLYHVISITLAYVLMLCVMTMNALLMISVVLGSGIGHFVMRPLISRKLGEQLGHIPTHKTNPILTEETKPLNDHSRITENGDTFGESSELSHTDTTIVVNRESVI